MRIFNFVKDIAHIKAAEQKADKRKNTNSNELGSSERPVYAGRDNGDAVCQEEVLAIDPVPSRGAGKEEKESCQAAGEEKGTTQAAEEEKRAKTNAEGRKSSKRNSKRATETGS